MSVTLPLTEEQIGYLKPFFGVKETKVLVCNLHKHDPAIPGWVMTVHALPAERRDAIRAACAGTLKVPRGTKKRKSEPQPVDSTT